jgi:hypothetical protein
MTADARERLRQYGISPPQAIAATRTRRLR